MAATVALSGLGSLVALITLPGTALASLEGFVLTAERYAGSGLMPEVILRADSLLGLLTHPIHLVTGDSRTTYDWALSFPPGGFLVPGLLWLGFVAMLCVREGVPETIKLCLVLSLSQLLVPTSQMYTAGWSGIAAVLLIADWELLSDHRRLRATAWGAVIASTVPVAVGFGGYYLTPWAALIAPISWVATGIVAARAPRQVREGRLKIDTEEAGITMVAKGN